MTDESTPPQVGFGADLASAAGALASQPSVPLVSLAVMLLFSAIPHVGPPSSGLVFVAVVIALFQGGWFGAERVFFQRHVEGKPVTVRHLVGLVPAFMGRFFATGVLTFG